MRCGSEEPVPVTTIRLAEIQIDYSIVLTVERYWSICKKVKKALGGLGWSSRSVRVQLTYFFVVFSIKQGFHALAFSF